jgi:hypothetical protein
VSLSASRRKSRALQIRRGTDGATTQESAQGNTPVLGRCVAALSVVSVTLLPMRPDIENAKRPRRAKGELAHAVVDGPHGTHAVELSPVRAEALRLKALHEESFWCGIQAGGCGGGLVLAAGPIRVPYFRHQSGADCALAGDSARAARSYEHLHYQRALLTWLEAQGLSATTEHHLGPDGRADLHVIVHSRHHTIEVQLSPIGVNEWRRRDDGYHRQVDHVTWLYGAAAETAAAVEQADRGHALHIRTGAETGTAIEIGVVTDLNEAWSRWRSASCAPSSSGHHTLTKRSPTSASHARKPPHAPRRRRGEKLRERPRSGAVWPKRTASWSTAALPRLRRPTAVTRTEPCRGGQGFTRN